MNYQERIVSDAGICGGQPVIRGTRVLVRVILGYLAHGEPTETILREFPSLTEADVRAVISFAAAAASEDLPATAPPIASCSHMTWTSLMQGDSPRAVTLAF